MNPITALRLDVIRTMRKLPSPRSLTFITERCGLSEYPGRVGVCLRGMEKEGLAHQNLCSQWLLSLTAPQVTEIQEQELDSLIKTKRRVSKSMAAVSDCAYQWGRP